MDPNFCLKDEEDQYVNDRFAFLDEHAVGDSDGQTGIKMQPSLRAQNTHTLEVTGQDVGQIEAGKQKKKKKTGRAKHRKQYNKWFMNGVPIFGNKKGHTRSSS